MARKIHLLATTGGAMAAVLAASVCPAQAQEAVDDAPQVEAVIVQGLPLGQRDDEVISNVGLLSGDELIQRRQTTLGETLSGIPGVNSDTFGGGASRPVIRGQTSPRVKVLSDGTEVIDASAVSPDHAVAAEVLLLDGIEILRGPSALLYGGGAIGGAVNLLDSKIPTAIPADGISGVAELRGGTADSERAAVVGLTMGTGNFAFRLEAVDRQADDYRIPRYFAPHDDHDHEGLGDDDHDDPEDEDFITRVAGSFSNSRTLSAGGSWIGPRGYLGLAYTDLSSGYGLPGHAHEFEDCHPHGLSLHCGGHDDHDDHDDDDHGEHHQDGDTPVVDLQSRRLDVRGEILAPFTGIERIRVRGGWTDYRHDEIEDGAIGTTFLNKGHDVRVEVEHSPLGGLGGVLGFQTSRSDFAALGAEAFIPPSLTRHDAVFILEQRQWGPWRVEVAARQEWQDSQAVGRPDTSHDPFSASGAFSWTSPDRYSVTFSAARSQRAPNPQELYARGVHLATNTFEIGQPDLKVETANTLEVTLRKSGGPTTFTLGAYRHRFDDYIYAETLDQIEEFRLIRYTQADAVFSGLDGEIRHQFTPNFSLGAFGDLVNARLQAGGALPRIPAGRLGLRAEGGWNAWSGALEYVRVFSQGDIADFETPTPGYDLLNATAAYDLDISGRRVQLFVRGTNLLNELALNHASFIKDAAPLRGRNFVAGVRARF